ncbi:hypothetical protein SAMN05216420_10458 [Nitrosospira sp. Nl5]|nr:hypothetical protein SAMN05216420_10458 [Nitrosospira sp. Nl5]
MPTGSSPVSVTPRRAIIELCDSPGLCELKSAAGSLPGLTEIGCKSVWTGDISPLFRPIEQLLAFRIVKICPRQVTLSHRFKSDRLLAQTNFLRHLNFIFLVSGIILRKGAERSLFCRSLLFAEFA